MSPHQSTSRTPTVAVISVCLDPSTVEQVVRTTAHLASSPVHAPFDTYLSESRVTHVPAKVAAADACVALIDFDLDADRAADTAAFLHQIIQRKLFVVAVTSDTDPEMPLRAMRSGCTEILLKPLEAEELRSAFKRMEMRWSRAVARSESSGRVISFFGCKGGVGTTTLAVHLALHLVQCHKKRTLLIDNHSQLGHVCLYLGMDGNKYHFNELLSAVNRLDRELLNGFVAKHDSGLHVLASPDAPEGPRHSTAEAVERTLDFLREEYDFVLIDGEAFSTDGDIAAIRSSEQVYIVATPEIGAIRDMSRYVEGLLNGGQSLDKFKVVLNRHSSKDALDSDQIQRAVKLPVMLKIPNSYVELVRAINIGKPIPPDSKADFSQHIARWSANLAGSPTSPGAPTKRRLALWK